MNSLLFWGFVCFIGFCGFMVMSAAENTLVVNMVTDCERDIDYALEDTERLRNPLLKADIDKCYKSYSVEKNPRINAKARELMVKSRS